LDIARKYPAFIPYLSPTHLIRTEALFHQAITFGKMGGMIDFSTGGTRFDTPHNCVMKALEAGAPLSCITFSSDGRGGVRRVDPQTGMDTYKPAPLDLNLKEMVLLVKEAGLPLEQALQLITVNPAKNMKLLRKGKIKEGYDADLCFLDEGLNLTDVFAKGEQMMENTEIVKKGRYEK
jgi:beta-aspartyl-dipeptidase (metallo-type)